MGGRKTDLINAIIDALIDPVIDAVNIRPGGFRVIVKPITCKIIKGRIEHLDNIGTFVADDGLGLGIPKHRHGDSARIVGLSSGVEFMVAAGTKEPIAHLRRAVQLWAAEHPALVQHIGVYDGYANMFGQAF